VGVDLVFYIQGTLLGKLVDNSGSERIFLVQGVKDIGVEIGELLFLLAFVFFCFFKKSIHDTICSAIW
jgi:hypothetical protein